MKSNVHQSSSHRSTFKINKPWLIMCLAVLIGLGLTASVLGVANAARTSTEPVRAVLQETQPPVETPAQTPWLTETLLPAGLSAAGELTGTQMVSPTQVLTPTETVIPTELPPTAEILPTESPTTEVPATAVPTTEVPATEVPTTEAPATAVPTAEAPATEVPATEAPATVAPTAEAPATEVPATEAPATAVPTTEITATLVPTESLPGLAPVESSPTGEKPQSPDAGDLQVHTTMSPDNVRPGAQLTVTIRYTNTRSTAVANVIISDTLSKGQTFDGTYSSNPLIPTSQFTTSGTSTTGYLLKWTLPSLQAYGKGSIIFHTTVFTTQPDQQKTPILLGNAVDIYTLPLVVSGSSANANSMVVGPMLSISKSAAPASVLPGSLLTYTLNLQNKTRADCLAATYMLISETLPVSTTFISADGGGAYTAIDRTVRWQIAGPLACGASLTRRFVVRVSDRFNSTKVINAAKAYEVTSLQLIGDRSGTTTVSTTINPPLKKTATDSKKRTSPQAYPTEEITYTITVYNPLNAALSGVIVTDTLPGNPVPFTFVRATPGSPVPQILSGGKLLVWTIDLPASGSKTFSFVVQIPRQTTTGNGPNLSYSNVQLVATHPAAYFAPQKNLAPVRVNAAMTMIKSVAPAHAMTGEEVIYTLKLTNHGPFPFNSIRITDTLPAKFDFARMDYGTPPLPGYEGSTVVWDGIFVPVGATLELRFVVTVDGMWLTTYRNSVRAYSADAYIPPVLNVAGVKIDPPLSIYKTVDPNMVFLNDIFEYEIGISNRSEQVWVLSEVTDQLPAGFYQVGGSGGNKAAIPVDPDYAIPPGGTWTGTFLAQAAAVTCSSLPKSFPNASGAIVAYMTSPEVVQAVNSASMAAVLVQPNIEVTLKAYRQTVQPGTLISYTLTLENISPYAAQGASLNLTIPAEFVFQHMIHGPAPSMVNNVMTWTNVYIPANATIAYTFRVLVPESASLGTKAATFSGSASGICFGRLSTKHVVVAEDVVLLSKTGPSIVGSLALVNYELNIVNKDSYPLVLSTLVDTLPYSFTYQSVASSPAPSLVQGRVVAWNNLTIQPGKTTIKLVARSANLYGTYWNNLTATSTETSIKMINGAPVTVAPVLDLKKDTISRSYVVGSRVPYTITVLNLSGMVYNNVVVTDLLPPNFTFGGARPGYPIPSSLGPNKTQPAWTIATLPKNGVVRLAFDAIIGGLASPGLAYNQVVGSSPSGQVPGTGNTAPITVTLPVGINYLPVINR